MTDVIFEPPATMRDTQMQANDPVKTQATVPAPAPARDPDLNAVMEAMTRTNQTVSLLISRINTIVELNGLRVPSQSGTKTHFEQR